MKKIEVIDLFCGIGGLTCGLEQSGLNVLRGYDFDHSCKFAYEYNNESKFFHKDIRKITSKEIKESYSPKAIKILVGCAPCQPFSNHQKNKKNRSSHKDWGLLYEFLRLIKGTKPHIISMENVPQIVKEEVFNNFIEVLETLNYKVTYEIVNVADYGVAQNRKRLILLATRGKRNIQIIESNKYKKNNVEDVIGHLPRIKAGETSKDDILHRSANLSEMNIERIKQSIEGGTWKDWDENILLECYKRKSGQTYSSVYGRLSRNKPSGTLTTQFTCYGSGRFGHYEQNRALSLREGALLQSFPESYKFVSSTSYSMVEISRQIGNAVPPRLGEVIGESIMVYLGERNKNE